MRRELVWIHDLEGVKVGAIGHDFEDIWTDERFRQSEQLGFTIPATHPKASLILEDVEIRHRGRRYFVSEIEQNRDGSETTIRVECDAWWYRLADTTYVGSFVLDDVTPAAGLKAILADTDWSTDEDATSSSETFSLEQQDRSILELLRAWERVTGLFLRFDTSTTTVALTSSTGAASGLSFRYARNIAGIRKRRRPPEVTVLYPYGADGLTIAGVNGGAEYVEDFSFYTDQGLSLPEARARYTRSAVWSDATFLRDVDLLPAAEARLATLAAGETGYEIDVVDLSEQTGLDETTARAGDTVRVFDPDLGDDVRPIVTRIRRHWLDPIRNRIELGTLPTPVSDGSASSRASSSEAWLQFVGPIRAEYQVRNDGTYTIARIPLRFRDGGRANYHLDFVAVGVGAGTMHVTIYDAANAGNVFRTLDVPYTDGETVRAFGSWAAEELSGSYDYRVRVTTTASGGPDPANGVDIARDDIDAGESSWWVMVQGAVQETPTTTSSQTFNYTGAVQTFTVPDGITSIDVFARAAGGNGAAAWGGRGAEVTARTFAVTPGSTLYVYVGGEGGWPNGGEFGNVGGGGAPGGYGGGSSHVLETLDLMASALIVAGAGGGVCPAGTGRANALEGIGPGDGGFYRGTSGNGPAGANYDTGASSNVGGGGATQFAGGAAGNTGFSLAEAGSFGQGGDAADTTSGLANGSGGGGGGWYGGGGADRWIVQGAGRYGGDGGGGSGYVRSDATDLELADAVNIGNGQVVISWEPLA